MKTEQDYCVFTAAGVRFIVRAPSLRTALRRFDEKANGIVVAAVETKCLPVASAENRPFMAVFLNRPEFVPPENPE